MAGNGKATINEILWQPVTMYIHIYIYICAVSEFLPKTILFSGRESFRNHKHRPLGIASMFKEYKLVNIFFLQLSIAHGPGDASLYFTETHAGLSFLMYHEPTIL